MRRQLWQTASFGEGERTARRVQLIIIVLLTAALAVSLIFMVPNLGVRENVQRTCLERMFSEAENAVTKVQKLSGSSINNVPIAEIRCHVSVIKSINALYVSNGGRENLTDDRLDAIIRQIDAIIEDAKTLVHTTTIDQKVYPLRDDLVQLRTDIYTMVYGDSGLPAES